MTLLWYVALGLWQIGLILCHDDHHHVPSAKAEEIKEKLNKNQWEVSDLVDFDHLKSELKEVLELQEKGELSHEEASVYLFRSHDFDSNGKLDGLEIGAILRHTIGDNATEDIVEKAVDSTMMMDLDNDGFIAYPELKVQMEKSKAEHPKSR